MRVTGGYSSRQTQESDVSHFLKPPAAVARLCARYGELGARKIALREAAEGEASEIEEALRLLGPSGVGSGMVTERVAVRASFYPNLYRAALTLLIDAREKARLSQAELAARFGLPEQLVVSYEAGARLLDVGEFVAICRAIGVDPYQVLRDAEQAGNAGFGEIGSSAADAVIEK